MGAHCIPHFRVLLTSLLEFIKWPDEQVQLEVLETFRLLTLHCWPRLYLYREQLAERFAHGWRAGEEESSSSSSSSSSSDAIASASFDPSTQWRFESARAVDAAKLLLASWGTIETRMRS